MLPIIFIHNRNSDYLPISLWKARATNPESELILIGDFQNAHFGTIVKHVDKAQYLTKANAFAASFENFSTNPHHFELICLQRWMILEEYLIANKINACLYIDSDVLLFDKIQQDANRFSAYGMTVAGISGHSNFINGLETLSSFCKFIKDAYSSEANKKLLEEKYIIFKKSHPAGGISDMTFFTEFRALQPDKVLDIADPLDGIMYDITITYTLKTKAKSGIKSLRWREGKPFAESLLGESIEMRSLHFQGDSKKYMIEMAGIQSITFKAIYQTNRAMVFIQKVWNKVFR